jgi:hypothetical protein
LYLFLYCVIVGISRPDITISVYPLRVINLEEDREKPLLKVYGRYIHFTQLTIKLLNIPPQVADGHQSKTTIVPEKDRAP